MIGKQLAHYQVTERIGAGGMGEVYRARDTRLGREVALKLLPAAFAQDDERLGRFKREAKLLAQLNHAHIATLHGLEEADGQHFLVMELVEGDDLAERLGRGPMPVDEALAIVRDVADALQAAHAQGIVHRDLKPANIKVTPEGKVKVLDFGLAKALESEANDKDLTTSPTVATAMGTMGGVILGTAAYMSPEQARGKPVDKLTDVWAMGCVLYEMLTAAQAFPGETVSDTIARILEREPDWQTLPANTPAPIHRLLRRCLQKDKGMRLQDVGEIRVEIDGTLSGASSVWDSGIHAAPAAQEPPRGKRPIGWMALALVATVAAVALALALFQRPVAETPLLRTSIPAPVKARFNSSGDFAGPVILSPDGSRVAFTAIDDQLTRRLYVRELRELEAQALPGTEGATFPFWSPDGRSIGYFDDVNLLRVELSGGLPITICPAPNGRGGTWSNGGDILFAPDFRSGIHRVRDSGGTPERITVVDSLVHSTHRWPFALPDGEHFLYVAAHHDVSQSDQYGVYFASINGGEPRRVVKSGAGAVFASGHLLYMRDNTLTATPFDPAAGEFNGDPVAMVDKVEYDPTIWRASFTASSNGLLAYHGDTAGLGAATRLLLLDREGNQVDVVDDANAYYQMSMTDDGKRIAVTARSDAGASLGLDIWLYEVDRDLRTRLTFGDASDLSPVWSPDGARIAYTSIYVGAQQTNSINVMLATGGGQQVLYEATDDMWLTDWSPDGKYLLFARGDFVGDNSHVWVLPLEGGDAFPLLVSDRVWEDGATVSPDGRWVAYSERTTGVGSVHVSPFSADPSAGDPRQRGKWQISSEGGSHPLWNADGTEIYFIQTDGRVWSARVEASGSLFRVVEVEVRFVADPWNFGRIGFDASSNGDLFLVNSFADGASPPITLVQNWLAELSR